MKKSLFLAMAVSMAMFIGCEDSSSGSSVNAPDDNSAGNSSSVDEDINSSDSGNSSSSVGEEVNPSTPVEAFFPEGYDASNVEAWYATDPVTSEDHDQTKTIVEAVYLFQDGSFIVTEQKKKVRDVTTIIENAVVAGGTWNSEEGDYKNGVILITMEGMDMPLTISAGKFTITPGGEETFDFSLMETGVPEPRAITEEEDHGENNDSDGTAEQLEWAKKIIANSESEVSEIASFDISEPNWEAINSKENQYMATFTVKVTLSSGEFLSDEGLEYPVLAIGQYPVHAIDSAGDHAPMEWNNNNWEISDKVIEGKSMTVTMTEKIDNLKLGRAYVYIKREDGQPSIEYSEAFLIVPPGSEDALK